MRLLTAFTLLMICLIAIVLTFPTKKDKRQKTLTNYHPLTNYPSTYVDTESKYTASTGIVVIIQNSIPRGEGYTDSAGKTFEGRIFWSRVINETDTPLELTINFPAEILRSTDSYLKVFLPQDTMTLDKETLWSYGITGLKSFLDTGFNKPSRLQRTIHPKEACGFYVVVVFHVPNNGAARAELVLKEQDLFYKIRGIAPELDSTLIPCGQIVFKN